MRVECSAWSECWRAAAASGRARLCVAAGCCCQCRPPAPAAHRHCPDSHGSWISSSGRRFSWIRVKWTSWQPAQATVSSEPPHWLTDRIGAADQGSGIRGAEPASGGRSSCGQLLFRAVVFHSERVRPAAGGGRAKKREKEKERDGCHSRSPPTPIGPAALRCRRLPARRTQTQLRER